MKRALLWVAVLSPLFARVAGAAPTVTIAVMPFKDLSGAGSAVGEAIRETVTTDLGELSGVKVIERGNLDKILAEQNLQAQRADLDPGTAARVGKLLGATLICGGAYQRVPPMVRLTARFVSVETGQIIDTAKVDGAERDFLKLQDRITAQLLRHAKLGGSAQKFEQRSRPPVKGGMKTIEHYGQSLLADNDDAKVKYLKLALADDADFTYAANDLAALEKRMRVYESNADAARDKIAREAHAQLSNETDPGKFMALMMQIFAGLQQSHRFRAMAAEARYILKNPPHLVGAGYPGMPKTEEMAWFWLVTAEQSLGDLDGILRDGEKFMREYPASMYFSSIKSYMDTAISEKQKVADGKAGLAEKLAEAAQNKALAGDLCKLGFVYAEQSQYREAQESFHKCIDAGGSKIFPAAAVLPTLMEMNIKARDWKAARKDMAYFERVDPAGFRNIKMAYEIRLPAD